MLNGVQPDWLPLLSRNSLACDAERPQGLNHLLECVVNATQHELTVHRSSLLKVLKFSFGAHSNGGIFDLSLNVICNFGQRSSTTFNQVCPYYNDLKWIIWNMFNQIFSKCDSSCENKRVASEQNRANHLFETGLLDSPKWVPPFNAENIVL